VREDGRPNLLSQPWKKADAQAVAVVVDSGSASGHLEQRSIIVRLWDKPFEEGRGPTMSILTCVKRWAGTGIAAGGGWDWW
jgi:hypothetical protein